MNADHMIQLLQKLLDAAEDHEDDGGFVTTREIAFAQDLPELPFRARRKLDLLVQKGAAEKKVVHRVDALGRPYTCLGYRVKS